MDKAAPGSELPVHVVIISIDGMKPDSFMHPEPAQEGSGSRGFEAAGVLRRWLVFRLLVQRFSDSQ